MLCVVSFAQLSFAQENADKVIVLQNADSLVGRVIDGEEVRELIGNVSITQGRVLIRCDRGLQYLTSGKVVLTGHVSIREDSLTFLAPRGNYYRDQRWAEGFDDVRLDDGTVTLTAGYGQYFVEPKRAFFRGRVVVVDSTSTVVADSLTYFRETKRSIGVGRVIVESRQDRVWIFGGRLDHDGAKNFSRMTADPVLVQIDTAAAGKADTLIVHSRVMEAYRDSTKILLAIDSVEIARSEFAGRARLAAFYTAADSLTLRGAPVLWYQRTQITGDSINVFVRKRKLRSVVVMGNGFAISRGDSLHPDRFDQLTADKITMTFGAEGLERINADARATSVYHAYEDSAANGLNKTSGDRIVMTLADGKMQTIRIFGGVEGQYFPENMVVRREKEYALDGFKWRDTRPRQILPPRWSARPFLQKQKSP